MDFDSRQYARIEDKVVYCLSGCWLSTYKPVPGGYTRIHKNETSERLLHRYSYLIYNGTIDKNKLICHKCNNKLCVNPDHLYQGTNKDNTLDMIKAGTHNIVNMGMRIRKKLTSEQYQEIYDLAWNTKLTRKEIASEFDISVETVSLIKHDKYEHRS